jgi:hypothetical protein
MVSCDSVGEFICILVYHLYKKKKMTEGASNMAQQIKALVGKPY